MRRALSDDRMLLLGVVLLAGAVRFVAIGAHLSTDDGYSYLVSSSPTAHVFLERLAGYENTPPLLYLLLAQLPLGHAAWLRVPAAVPGVLSCLLLYFVLRRPLGTRAALLAALALAAAPLAVTYADLARGFMLDDFALLLALWAILELGEDGSQAWWVVYVVAGVVALYTEYDAAIFLLALSATALWLGTRDRRKIALIGPLPLLALVPWLPQLLHAQHAVGRTKLAPTFPGPSPGALRDLIVTLALGENGGVRSAVGRWLEVAVIVVLGAAAIVMLRRPRVLGDPRRRRAIVLLTGTGALTLIAHAVAGAAGVDIFTSRYLTILIPITAALAAAALVATGNRSAVTIATILLVTLGLVGIKRRYHHQWEPDLRPVRVAALAMHPATVLTNSSVVMYYLRAMHPLLDRPFNLGAGRGQECRSRCLIVDDVRVRGGPARQVSGSQTVVGPFVLTLKP